jgi:hypothetical protein
MALGAWKAPNQPEPETTGMPWPPPIGVCGICLFQEGKDRTKHGAHACNSSHLEGEHQEDHSSRPVCAKSQ